ncbi:hypothetical protein BJ165DRAFT_870717 [Panaeolus papilionaceus]|nr:hypothetical protein BJ165DRAFT_870717 [Panaeolus papilionaceus]
MYSKWKKASNLDEYAAFGPAIDAAMEKIDEYYNRTAASSAHIVCMALDPEKKFTHFEKSWGYSLTEEVKETVKTKFIERYNQLHCKPLPSHVSSGSSPPLISNSTSRSASVSVPKPRLGKRRVNISNLSDDESAPDSSSSASAEPWRSEWDSYLTTREIIPDGMGIVQWWGVRHISSSR